VKNHVLLANIHEWKQLLWPKYRSVPQIAFFSCYSFHTPKKIEEKREKLARGRRVQQKSKTKQSDLAFVFPDYNTHPHKVSDKIYLRHPLIRSITTNALGIKNNRLSYYPWNYMHSINHQLVTLIEIEQVQWVHVTVYSLKVGWRKNKTWTWTLPLALQEPNRKYIYIFRSF